MAARQLAVAGRQRLLHDLHVEVDAEARPDELTHEGDTTLDEADADDKGQFDEHPVGDTGEREIARRHERPQGENLIGNHVELLMNRGQPGDPDGNSAPRHLVRPRPSGNFTLAVHLDAIEMKAR